MEFLTSPVFLALIGTIFGSAGLKVIEHWLSRAKAKEDSAKLLREELRSEIDRKSKDYAAELDRLRGELAATEKELDNWRDKYYALIEEHIKMKTEYAAELANIKRQISGN